MAVEAHDTDDRLPGSRFADASYASGAEAAAQFDGLYPLGDERPRPASVSA
jgi:hypothetical protein